MNDIIKKLKVWGCDIDGAMERFMDDEELYITCLETVLYDENFDNLGNALKENNVQTAFESAHTLKGVLSNMGLTPLNEPVVKIVEPLRNGQSENLMQYYDELLKQKEHLLNIFNQNN